MNNLEGGFKKLVADIPHGLHEEFRQKVFRMGSSIKEVLVEFVEKFVEANCEEEEIKKKTSNPEDKLKSVEELVGEILEARKAQAVVIANEVEKTEKAEKSKGLKVHTVEIPVAEKPIEKLVEKDNPEPVIEKPIEKPIVKERVVVAEDGIVAEKIVAGKKVVVVEREEALLKAKKIVNRFRFPHEFNDEFHEALALVKADEKEKRGGKK